MRKRTYYGLSIAFLVIGITSCGKSTHAKIANNWTIVSSDQEDSGVNEDGDKGYTRTSFTETTISIRSEQTPSGGTTTVQESTGKVSTNVLTIKKDGTWIWNQELSYDGNQGGVSVKTNSKTIQSGTWNFVAKNKADDFKKNERLALNVLVKSTSVFQTQAQVLVNSSGHETTFLAGENMLIYTIVKSTNKELQLRMEKNYQSTIDGEVNKSDRIQNMTLKAN